MAGAHRIGILTSGGDAPGMNPAIRAIVRTAGAAGITCIGIRRGYAGLINGDVFELTGNDVDGIARRGVRVVGIPATIDNDMGCTEYTIGFDTACNTAIEAIDKLRDTGQSHERVSVVEVMGRNAGHLALYTAMAAGASAVLLPEKEVDLEHDVIDVIRRGCIHGRRHHIVVVAEGVGHVHEYAKTIEEETGLETRVTVLGYIQRGGAPSGRDRVSAAMMGVRAIDVLKSDASSRVIVERNGRFEDMDIEEALQMKRELDEEMFVACNRIDTSYQYHHKTNA